MRAIEERPDQGDDRHRRDDRDEGGDDALPARAAVETLLEGARILAKAALDRHAPFECPPLLESQCGEDREQLHPRRTPRRAGVGAPAPWTAARVRSMRACSILGHYN